MTHCRHFKPMHFDGDGSAACALGYPIRKIVIAANKGSISGIFPRLPCTGAEDSLANCPGYDAKTPEEIAAGRERMNAAMDSAILMMSSASRWKSKMIAQKRSRGRASCPCCGEKNSVRVTVAIDYNNHMSCMCEECGVGFRE